MRKLWRENQVPNLQYHKIVYTNISLPLKSFSSNLYLCNIVPIPPSNIIILSFSILSSFSNTESME